ncbi:helix-turn-helix domain-containing protein [Rhodobacteraceae bacterium 2CG4]|uniref:Helix-turn-helix domain-containing protein n=1 Tax=Halovulum marinum TaxID=2662447 RepID=A0A6L5Z295_9RHOB|nr:GlxA family transcriptional regulator [Halovulum marinum]MSU90200.1 helix-turn-helix domain-containing protein [Halovulum marinum]
MSEPEQRPKPYVFLLLEQFTLLAFASALEPLRLANWIAKSPLYQWQVVAGDGAPVPCSAGMAIQPDGGLEDLPREATVIVVGGVDVKRAVTKPVLTWLRRESRKGVTVGAICTGAQALAMAGLLEGRRATIHWDNRDSFAEEFPEIELTQNVFVIDGNRLTASGGTTPSDLMLRLIARDHGTPLANAVADQMIHTSIRSERDAQRMSIPTRIGVRHPKLASVIEKMEQNIEEPVSPSVLASDVGMSTRQLERLFRRYLNRSPKRYYMELRLNRARNLLLQTDMSVINVALACGFASPSHFSKCYRAQFGNTPYRERGTQAENA